MEKVTVRDLIARLSELNPDAEIVTESNAGFESKFVIGFDCANKQTKQTSKTVIVFVTDEPKTKPTWEERLVALAEKKGKLSGKTGPY